MKEQFKQKLENEKELIDTIDMQIYALQRYMALLGFHAFHSYAGFNEGQYGFRRLTLGSHVTNTPGIFKSPAREGYLSFEDAVSMYNGNMTYKASAGLYKLCSPKGDNTITFDPTVLSKAENMRIFDKIGLQWSKKQKKIVSTKKLLKFN